MQSVSAKYLSQILKLVDHHKLDSLELPGIKVSKRQHTPIVLQPGGHGSAPVPPPNYEPTTLEELDAEIKRTMEGPKV